MAFFVLILLNSSFVFAMSIGVSPNKLFFEESVINRTYGREIVLINSNEFELSYEILVTGFDCYDFFPRKGIIEANSTQKVLITCTIPTDLKFGLYESVLIIKPSSTQQLVGLIPSLGVKVKIVVSEGVQIASDNVFEGITVGDADVKGNNFSLINTSFLVSEEVFDNLLMVESDLDAENLSVYFDSDNLSNKFGASFNLGVIEYLFIFGIIVLLILIVISFLLFFKKGFLGVELVRKKTRIRLNKK
ncbi:hypothetical protein HN587_04250 [Candidatus Woesearchaeota archaeon]|nr:hypothetical protein [Candidatus Woesearchaeota archaeon]